jgi:hypothetical protein
MMLFLAGIAQPSPEAQAVSRDLLRDAVYDGAADAISYLEVGFLRHVTTSPR